MEDPKCQTKLSGLFSGNHRKPLDFPYSAVWKNGSGCRGSIGRQLAKRLEDHLGGRCNGPNAMTHAELTFELNFEGQVSNFTSGVEA